MSLKPGHKPTVRRPFEEEVRRDVACPHCGLDQSVYGLATWCTDCGDDIFLTHVAAELSVVYLMLGDIERRREYLTEEGLWDVKYFYPALFMQHSLGKAYHLFETFK